MVAALAVLIGALSGFAAGGRVRNLLRTDVRFLGFAPLWAIFGLGAHMMNNDLAFAFLLLSLCSALAFVFGNARRIPGLWLVGLGLALNLLVTANNHGMPYDPSALEAAGIIPPTLNATPVSTAITHPQGPNDQLVILGDVIPVAPLRTVVSFGDVFIAFGLAVVTMHGLTGRRDGRRALRFHVGRHRSGPNRVSKNEVVAHGAVELGADETRNDLDEQRTIHEEAIGSLDQPSNVDVHRRLDEAIHLVEVTGDENILLDLAPADASGNVTHLDLSELTARHAVRQALAKHDLASRVNAARYIDVQPEHVTID